MSISVAVGAISRCGDQIRLGGYRWLAQLARRRGKLFH